MVSIWSYAIVGCCTAQEVVYRKVLEDDGNRQYVELEQLGRWKFLIFSGSFATRIFLEQKRREKTVHSSS